MEDNFKLLNNVNIDLDKYEDLNIDKDKLKKKMMQFKGYDIKEI